MKRIFPAMTLSLMLAVVTSAGAEGMNDYMQLDCVALQKVRQQLEDQSSRLTQQGDTAAQQQNAQQMVAIKLLMRRKACPAP